MPDEIAALQRDGVLIRGFVEDTGPASRAARVSIAPAAFRRRGQGKINEAMNHGIPVVATTCAVEGMKLRPGEDVLVADDAEAFAQAIADVYQDAAPVEQTLGGRYRQRSGAFARGGYAGGTRSLWGSGWPTQ